MTLQTELRFFMYSSTIYAEVLLWLRVFKYRNLLWVFFLLCLPSLSIYSLLFIYSQFIYSQGDWWACHGAIYYLWLHLMMTQDNSPGIIHAHPQSFWLQIPCNVWLNLPVWIVSPIFLFWYHLTTCSMCTIWYLHWWSCNHFLWTVLWRPLADSQWTVPLHMCTLCMPLGCCVWVCVHFHHRCLCSHWYCGRKEAFVTIICWDFILLPVTVTNMRVSWRFN